MFNELETLRVKGVGISPLLFTWMEYPYFTLLCILVYHVSVLLSFVSCLQLIITMVVVPFTCPLHRDTDYQYHIPYVQLDTV